MSSGFSGGVPDFFATGGRSTNINSSYNPNLNPQQQFSFRSPLYMVPPNPDAQIRRPDLVGKRSLAEFQQLNRQGLGFYHRNVKSRPNYLHASPISTLSQVEFSPVPSSSPEASSVSSLWNSVNSGYGLPILHRNRLQRLTLSNGTGNNASASVCSPSMADDKGNGQTGTGQARDGSGLESEKKMMSHRLQELEKVLLGDEEEGEAVSVVSDSELSQTIQNLIGPTQKPVSSSPTSSPTSCCSTSASPQIPCTKQSLMDAAVAISEGKFEVAAETITRLQQVANPRGTSEQRLTAYMVTALNSRVKPTGHPTPAWELYGKEHTLSAQMLYDVSPCFMLGFMASNLAILEATSEQGFHNIHVLDFDIGNGRRYAHLLHALASRKSDNKRAVSLKITTIVDLLSSGEEKLKGVGEGLKILANKINVCLNFSVKKSNIKELSREKLGVDPNEVLAVNLAFKLYQLPDESVTTDNLRDELLRRVKGLSPKVVTLVEQDMNANTAPLTVRVREACEHYGALFDSLDATASRENPDRVRIEAALGRRMGNSVACEGKDRVERCEVFGKWRARMSMAGFQPVPTSRTTVEELRMKLNSRTRGNPGFTVNEQSGGICFGWMGRNLTVASAWR